MTYAAVTDLIEAFGEREVISLTDRDMLGVVDSVVAHGALVKADNEINPYLVGGRYTFPLSVVPSQLTDMACDIARYKLSGSDVQETDIVRARFKDALKKLEAIRDGRLDIGLSLVGEAPASSGTVQMATGSRVFTNDSLDGFS